MGGIGRWIWGDRKDKLYQRVKRACVYQDHFINIPILDILNWDIKFTYEKT